MESTLWEDRSPNARVSLLEVLEAIHDDLTVLLPVAAVARLLDKEVVREVSGPANTRNVGRDVLQEDAQQLIRTTAVCSTEEDDPIGVGSVIRDEDDLVEAAPIRKNGFKVVRVTVEVQVNT